MTKVVFFTGGVYSSLGKGLTMASIGKIFKEFGFSVSVLKFDPYLNISSGSLSPSQHGEVYVTEDGCETDLDLGHYERFLEKNLSCFSCVTAGKIYKRLLDKSDSSGHSGETIQVVPNLINEICSCIYELLEKESNPDFLFVEIGGTIGDLESIPFIEAASRFKFRHGPKNVLFVHISPILYLSTSNEYKTKPTQHSIQKLSNYSIFPDLLILRSKEKVDFLKEKISRSSHIREEDIVFCLDQESIYLIAESLYEERVHEKILKKFNMDIPEGNIDSWKSQVSNLLSPKSSSLKVVLIGKYRFEYDAYLSINESLRLASCYLSIDLEIDSILSEDIVDFNALASYDAVCVPYGFGPRGIEGKMKAIEYCRINKIPFLGICYGMQLACIEYVQNALGNKEATSTEIDPNTSFPLLRMLSSGEMRLGLKDINIQKGTLAYKLFEKDVVQSRHRHRYFLNPEYFKLFDDTDFVISGFSKEEERIAEIVEMKNHPFFIATQFHPEFDTKMSSVSPLFIGFLRAGLLNKK